MVDTLKSPMRLSIPGFPNYLADTDGIIWTLKRKGGNARKSGQVGEPKRLKLHKNSDGYLIVNLDKNGTNYTKQVSRLILETFIGTVPENCEACHYPDPDKTNNKLENLRWDTHTENMKDKYRDRPPLKEKQCKSCLEIKPVSDFYADKRASDGLQTQCKKCHCITSVATRDKDKVRIWNREYMRKRRKENPNIGR